MEEFSTSELMNQVLGAGSSGVAEAALELAERANNSVLHCEKIIEKLTEGVRDTNENRRLQAVMLVELLTKNCATKFHLLLFSAKFCGALLKMLEVRRGMKKSFFNGLIAKKPEIQTQIEEKLLFLIQLWYDTFMLHESEFKEVIGVYKELRKSGVVFPKRNASDRFLINFEGEKSPIFECIENGRVYLDANQKANSVQSSAPTPTLFDQPDPRSQNREISPKSKSKKRNSSLKKNRIDEGDSLFEEVDHLNAEFEAVSLAPSELVSIQETIDLFEEILANATDMQSVCNEMTLELLEVIAEHRETLEKYLHQNTKQNQTTQEARKLLEEINSLIARHSKAKNEFAANPFKMRTIEENTIPKPTRKISHNLLEDEEVEINQSEEKENFEVSKTVEETKNTFVEKETNLDLLDLDINDLTPLPQTPVVKQTGSVYDILDVCSL